MDALEGRIDTAAAGSSLEPSPVSDKHAQNRSRRHMLLRTTEVLGGVGAIAAAYPFVASMQPSERARADGEPVEASWADLRPGELRIVAWRGKPVWLVRRSPETIASLRQPNPELADPDSRRSEQPESCRNARAR
jgi:ubiquinol-cytochrome c reductase iron-sulfur subunit